MCLCVYTCMYGYMRTSMSNSLSTSRSDSREYVWLCMYAYLCMYGYVCIYMHGYVCTGPLSRTDLTVARIHKQVSIHVCMSVWLGSGARNELVYMYVWMYGRLINTSNVF
jgi:hypothetical protein